MGDDFFNGLFPFVDLESGGSVEGLMAAVDKVMPECRPTPRSSPATARSPTSRA